MWFVRNAFVFYLCVFFISINRLSVWVLKGWRGPSIKSIIYTAQLFITKWGFLELKRVHAWSSMLLVFTELKYSLLSAFLRLRSPQQQTPGWSSASVFYFILQWCISLFAYWCDQEANFCHSIKPLYVSKDYWLLRKGLLLIFIKRKLPFKITSLYSVYRITTSEAGRHMSSRERRKR